MLKKQMAQYLEKLMEEEQTTQDDAIKIEVFKEEKEYIENHQLHSEISSTISFIEKDPRLRFKDAYIERCDKETEELLAEESSLFLEQPIEYFKNHKNEFMYLESEWFDLIGVDAISFEADSVFGTYDVMFGLKIQKKYETSLKSFLTNQLSSDEATFDLMFNANEGLWEINFALNYVNDFKENGTIQEAYGSVYRLLFQLVEAMEEEKNNLKSK
jgi:hypothetical protein